FFFSDDQGSLSSDDEERRSAEDSDSEFEDDGKGEKTDIDEESSDDGNDDPSRLLQMCMNDIEASKDRFESATQEETARLILRLAAVVAESSKNTEIVDEVFDEVVNAAGTFLNRIQQPALLGDESCSCPTSFLLQKIC
ncbi:unnamed protein product, partial [Strongylus vulgaris]